MLSTEHVYIAEKLIKPATCLVFIRKHPCNYAAGSEGVGFMRTMIG
jgi:hypothetical protein